MILRGRMRAFRKFRAAFAFSYRHFFASTARNRERPDLDFDYLLNPKNLQNIRANISNRKQVGDIENLHELWRKLSEFIADSEKRSTVSENNGSIKIDFRTLNRLWADFYETAASIPNRTHPETPIGDEKRASVARWSKKEKTDFDFQPLTCENLAQMLRAVRCQTIDICTLAGEKAYFLYDNVALLEKALIDFALNELLERRGFELIYVPDVLNELVPRKCGLTSRTELNIVYNVKNRSDLCLSGTGEMGVASYLENKIFDEEELPKKFTTVSRCFRPEAASGKAGKGLYRVHEFTKVEMFAVTADDDAESEKMLQELVDAQRTIFDGLELHYRLLDMPSQELGASAYRKFDIEAWMPGRKVYGEISSASNCTDFQSRRLGTKYRTSNGEQRFVHTVNGTACAATRLLIALVEQHQQKNKLVRIPDALQPFFNNWPFLYPSRTQLKTSPSTVKAIDRIGGKEA